VIDIALQVGFESLVTFNRAFQKIMNMSPSELRNAAQTREDQVENAALTSDQ
jgi:AraC-like DNA-binding protein